MEAVARSSGNYERKDLSSWLGVLVFARASQKPCTPSAAHREQGIGFRHVVQTRQIDGHEFQHDLSGRQTANWPHIKDRHRDTVSGRDR